MGAPTYEALLELANWIAGEDFAVRSHGDVSKPMSAEACLTMVRSMMQEQKTWARNVLAGRPMREKPPVQSDV